MSGILARSGAFDALTEPPYCMRICSATAEETFEAIQLRI